MKYVWHMASSRKVFLHTIAPSIMISLLVPFHYFFSPAYSQQNQNSTVQSEMQQGIGPSVKDPNLKVETVVSGLDLPTSMAFLGPNDFLVLEQHKGTVQRVTDGKILDRPLLNVNVSSEFFQGMLGIAVATHTGGPTYVFLCYTQAKGVNGGPAAGNNLYRYELVDNKLTNPKHLLSLPGGPATENNGGAATVGPDNNVYIVIGNVLPINPKEPPVETLTENYRNTTVVDGRSGILRVTQDGNPIGQGILGDKFPLDLYYAYGIKNSFGLAFDPLTGNLWDTEPGRLKNDEINIVNPGFNGGFGVMQGLATLVPAAQSALVDFGGKGKYHDPVLVWYKKVVPTGLVFLSSDRLGKQYQNDLFVGTYLADGKIYHFKLNANRTHLALPESLTSQLSIPKSIDSWDSLRPDPITFGDGFGGISDITMGPDGYLYVVSINTGIIYRIIPANHVTPEPSTNRTLFK
jgi:glucose/arabinose dehydrogenase